MNEKIKTINPATGEFEFEGTVDDDDAIARKISQAAKRFPEWRRTPLSERAGLLSKVALVLGELRTELAETMAREMGKPITQGRAEVDKCALVCRYYAEHGGRHLADREIETGKGRSYVTYQPLGVILAVMPWNFPLWQVFRFAAPNLMAGNVALLKHASNVPHCAVSIEKIFLAAGTPPHVFQVLLIPGSAVERVVGDPQVNGVTLTGGTDSGRSVAAAAGRALRKSVLELGGSDAYVILEDADPEVAAVTCAKSRLINGGQSCIAAKRFVVVESIRDRFEELMVREMGKVVMGEPLDERTELGPMARFDLRDELHRQVRESVGKGAKVLLGGNLPLAKAEERGKWARRGAYYEPTVLTGVRPGMPACDEELFGPVAAIVPATGRDDAIRIANDTSFGLGAAVFTLDREEGERIAREELEAGTCVVNGLVASDPRLPFGGIKESGYGRELSEEGIREFMNIKTVVVEG